MRGGVAVRGSVGRAAERERVRDSVTRGGVASSTRREAARAVCVLSASVGACEHHLTSAPRSTIPICMWKTMGAASSVSAKSTAVAWFVDVERKANLHHHRRRRRHSVR